MLPTRGDGVWGPAFSQAGLALSKAYSGIRRVLTAAALRPRQQVFHLVSRFILSASRGLPDLAAWRCVACGVVLKSPCDPAAPITGEPSVGQVLAFHLASGL